MIRIRVRSQSQKLRQIQANLTRSPSLFNTAWARQVGRIRAYAKERLRRKPGRPHYPIRWTSERQRRAFFASNGFGRGIPTQRTDRMVNAWEVTYKPTPSGGLLWLENPVSYAGFVVGDQQQGFHKDTGWYQVDDMQKDIRDYARDSLIETYYTVFDPFAGVSPS